MTERIISIDCAKKCILFLLPVSAAMGNFLLIADFGTLGLSFWRLLVLASCLFFGGLLWIGNIRGRKFLFLLYGWLSWGLLSLIWTPDLKSGASDMANLLFYLLLVFGMFNLRAYEPACLKAVCYGWVGAYAVSGSVAVWELATNNHLSGYWIDETMRHKTVEFATVSFFNNPNNYGAFIVLSVPFLWWALRTTQRKINQFLLLIFILSAPVFLITTGSRIALVGFIAQAIFITLTGRSKIKRIVLIAITGAVIFITISALYEKRAGNVIEIMRLFEGTSNDSSFEVRFNLLRNGVLMLRDSWGIGFGAGSYESVAESSYTYYPTGGIINSHNFFIQILSEYGVLIFIYFIYWYFGLFAAAFRSWRKGRHTIVSDQSIYAEVLMIGLTGYVFASLCHSSYMKEMTNWTFLATLNVIGAFLYNSEKLVPSCGHKKQAAVS